ncbi:MAG: serine acetyltransferase [Ruminococcus sp.]|nr:serine acetyltransferase [Ruminococcus sp.]
MNEIQTKISALTGKLMDDYGKGRVIDEIKMFAYPDRNIIIDILEKLKIVVYPGYHRNSNYRTYTVKNNISILLEDIIYNLIKQTSIVLRYAPAYRKADEETIARESERITFAFLDTIPKIREYIETDIQAFYDGDPAAYNKDEIICTYPGLYAIFTARVAHELFLLGVPLIPRIMTEYAHGSTGIDVNPGATIGEYFFIDHGTGIVIGETTIIGNHVKLYQGVTLGALSPRGGHAVVGKRHPTVGDNATIYSNASILGGETVIGANSVIGGNSFLTSSVEDNTKASVETPKMIFRVKKKP